MPFIPRRNGAARRRWDGGMREVGWEKEGTGHLHGLTGSERRQEGARKERGRKVAPGSHYRDGAAALPQVAVGRPFFRTRARRTVRRSVGRGAGAARRRPTRRHRRQRRGGSGCRMQLEVAFRSFASSRSSLPNFLLSPFFMTQWARAQNRRTWRRQRMYIRTTRHETMRRVVTGRRGKLCHQMVIRRRADEIS